MHNSGRGGGGGGGDIDTDSAQDFETDLDGGTECKAHDSDGGETRVATKKQNVTAPGR